MEEKLMSGMHDLFYQLVNLTMSLKKSSIIVTVEQY